MKKFEPGVTYTANDGNTYQVLSRFFDYIKVIVSNKDIVEMKIKRSTDGYEYITPSHGCALTLREESSK